ncbi:MAG: hypothetical protein R3C52_00955 [Hyphomonadaceae bacterium]
MKSNRIVRYLAPYALSGFVMAALFVLGLLANNVANLRTLVSTSDVGVLAVGLLTFFTGLTLASVQMGAAIMALGWKRRKDGDDAGLKAMLRPAPSPAPVRARSSNGR